MLQNKPFVLPHRARSEEQRQTLQEIIEADQCPFCGDNFFKYHRQPVIHEDGDWIMTLNDHPYLNSKVHVLLVPKQHAESFKELPDCYGASLWNMLALAEDMFNVASGGVVIRFGDPEHNGGSVRHFHVHMIVPDLNLDWESIKIKIGSKG